ncbi:hypothetical protein HF313_08810 [Massilia atriviolacea]|uniref:Uncharacterized protein n=1 Tax=Massilia atriviolacea TaxID=2495579 RepID=A0A430HDJ1_9BURK|nr:hypothetical protein [Massilia atriviolacea]RSZ55591.1 hypothetical protein EJB06_28985 [Massilia atriviolacea]
MTKTLKPTPTDEQPSIVELCGLTSVAFAQAEVLIRQGFSFSKACPPQFFPYGGQVALTLVPSLPDDRSVVAAAKLAVMTAMERQKSSEDAAAAQAASSAKEHLEKLAQKAKLAEEVDAARQVLKALEEAQQSIAA